MPAQFYVQLIIFRKFGGLHMTSFVSLSARCPARGDLVRHPPGVPAAAYRLHGRTHRPRPGQVLRPPDRLGAVPGALDHNLVPGWRIRPCWSSAWSRPGRCPGGPTSRFGAYVVAAWLLGIIVNLVSIGDYTNRPARLRSPGRRPRTGKAGSTCPPRTRTQPVCP